MLGRRVTLRYRIHNDPAHPYSEVVGVVMMATPDALTIVRKGGETVEVPVRDIETGRAL